MRVKLKTLEEIKKLYKCTSRYGATGGLDIKTPESIEGTWYVSREMMNLFGTHIEIKLIIEDIQANNMIYTDTKLYTHVSKKGSPWVWHELWFENNAWIDELDWKID